MAEAKKSITCITCPVGCKILVQGEGERISHMEGNQCKRGEEYARNEFIHPLRTLTTTVRVKGADSRVSPLLPVRSDKPVPRELLMQCMDVIKNTTVMKPVSRYDVIVPDILGTGANIVATGEIK